MVTVHLLAATRAGSTFENLFMRIVQNVNGYYNTTHGENIFETNNIIILQFYIFLFTFQSY